MATTDSFRRLFRSLAGSQRQRLETLFDERILPLASQIPAAERHALPMGPDAEAESYFVEREHRRMYLSDFGRGGCTLDDCEQELVHMWQAQSAPHLAVLAPELAKIARALHELGTDDSEVSEFVYVMY